jgi:acyl transferase domain-containing protein/NADPH:quinone reductase-like Zn-dependent oxidoreductase/acyl carrier protein
MFLDAVTAATEDGFTDFLEVSPHAIMGVFLSEILQTKGIASYKVLPTLIRGENGPACLENCLTALGERTATGIPATGATAGAVSLHSIPKAVVKPHQSAGSLSDVRRKILDLVSAALPDFHAGEGMLDRGFLQIGFTSLTALTFQKRLSEAFDIEIPLTFVFDYPTINLAAEYIHSTLSGGISSQGISLPSIGGQVSPKEPIAVIGMACRMPGGSNSVDEFWQFLMNRGDSAREVPIDRWDMDKLYSENADEPGKSFTKTAHFLEGISFKGFDASLFNVTPKEATALDPQHRWLLETSWEALEHAGIPPFELRGKNVGVYLGIVSDDYKSRHIWSCDLKSVDTYSASGSMPSSAGGRLSFVYGFQGPNVSVDTACSSSLVSLHLAVQGLRNRECDIAIAAGVNALFAPNLFVGFTKLGVLSRDGRCKAFDASADGYGRSEGCGVLVLKRLSDAERDRDLMDAVILGSAINQDGASSSFTAPSGTAQQMVVRRAYANAGITPDEIDFIEAHGTGTVLGDAIELNALQAVLRDRSSDKKVYLGSVKTNMGHSEGAAGIASSIKTILTLKNRTLPPHLHFHNPNTQFDWNTSGIAIPLDATPLVTEGRPITGSVSSYGFSGTNAHAVFSEAPERALKPANFIDRTHHLLMFSGREGQAVSELAERYRDFFRDNPAIDLGDVCYTASIGRVHFNHRLSVVGRNPAEMLSRLEEYLKNPATKNVVTDKAKSKQPEVVFLFSGQGSQYPGMARELYQTHPKFRETLDYISGLFEPHLNESLVEIFFSEEKGELINRTDITQPAIFAIQIALTDLWASWGVTPAAVAGHSIGEYAAAVTAGVFSLEDAVRLVAARGRLMHSAPGKGAMGVVFAPLEDVEAQIAPVSAQASVAAVNAPGMITISGEEVVIDQVLAYFKEKGVRGQRLVVSHAFHSPLMHPILSEFRKIASEVTYAKPHIKFFSCLTGEVETDYFTSPDYWTDHIAKPVEFMKGFLAAEGEGFDLFLEMGGDTTLSGLGKRCQQHTYTAILSSLRKKEPDWSCLLTTLGTLYTKGVSFDAHGYDQPYNRDRLVLPTYPFQRKEYWMENNSLIELREVKALAPVNLSLLGEELTSPALHGIRIFTNRTSTKTHQFLADHIIADRILYPGAAMWTQIYSAIRKLYGLGTGTIQNISFTNLLKMTPDSVRDTQLIIHEEGEAFRLQFASRDAARPDDPWNIHSEGYYKRYENKQLELIEPLGRDDTTDFENCDMEHFYKLMLTVGYNFGPSFKMIKEIHMHKDLVFSRVEEIDEVKDGVEYDLYPGLLDSLTVSTVAIGARPQLYEQLKQQGQVILPYTIDQVQFYRDMPKNVRCVSNIKFMTDRLISNADFLDVDGNLVAAIRGFHGKYVETSFIRKPDASELGRYLHTVGYAEKAHHEIESSTSATNSWLILCFGSSELQQRLVNRFRQEGHTAEVFDLESGKHEILKETITRLKPDRIAILELRSEDPDVAALLGQRLITYIETIRAIGSARWSGRISWITQGVHSDIASGYGINYPSSPIAGFVLSVEKEFPELTSTVFDISNEPTELELERLSAGMNGDSPNNQIVLRGGLVAAAQITPHHNTEKDDLALPESGAAIELNVQNRGTFQGLSFKQLTTRKAGKGEVKVTVHAAGLNFRDVLNLLGEYPGDAGKPGLEAVGIIESVGSDVTKFKPGDRVMVVGLDGLFASEVVVPITHVVAIPDQMSFSDAATIGTVFSTAWYGLHYLAELKAGDNVLIHAGAGGVGMAAIQIAKAAGAKIFATAGTEEKRSYLRRMGVEHVYDSRNTVFASEIMAATHGAGIDVVVNSLAGEFIPKSIEILKEGGRFIELGKKSWTAKEAGDLKPGVKFHQFDLMSSFGVRPDLIGDVMRQVMEGFTKSNQLTPLPRTVFPAAKARDAFKFMAQARHIGKIVISFEDQLNRLRIAREGLFRKDASYLVTGGTGGLGLKMAAWMVENGAGNVVLTGRREPDQSILAKLDAQVIFKKCDVSDSEETRNLIADISSTLPPLKGVFHLAGVLDDGLISDQTPEKFLRVLDPKVKGGLNLHNATKGLDLDYFVLFSSLAAVFGNAGQSNYSAANRFLDGLASYRREIGLPAISLNWGPWREVGMAAASDIRGDRLAEMGLKGMTPDDSLATLEKALRDNPVNIVVADIDWSRYGKTLNDRDRSGFFKQVQQSISKGSAADTRKVVKSNIKEELQKAIPSDRRQLLLERVLTTASGVIGFLDAESIELDSPLTNQGFDSLMAVELRNQLGQEMGASLPVSLLFDYPTVNEILTFLLADVLQLEETEKPVKQEAKIPEVITPSTADVLSDIEKLIGSTAN